jgi:membrane-associated protease RseP (regulator of RpoE activity)
MRLGHNLTARLRGLQLMRLLLLLPPQLLRATPSRRTAAGLAAATLGAAAAVAAPAALSDPDVTTLPDPAAGCLRLSVPSTAALSAASSPQHWAQRHPDALATATLSAGHYRVTIADDDVTCCVQRSAATVPSQRRF